jgi:mannose-6-phosphate isomerase-like protein (cupin superfamily)
MQASTFKLKTNLLTGGRSHTPLAKSGGLTMGLNFYTVGRKNKLHTHPGEDHAFVVIDGQATFYDKEGQATVLSKGEGIVLPDGYYYYFESTGTVPLAILRSSAARKDRPAVASMSKATSAWKRKKLSPWRMVPPSKDNTGR